MAKKIICDFVRGFLSGLEAAEKIALEQSNRMRNMAKGYKNEDSRLRDIAEAEAHRAKTVSLAIRELLKKERTRAETDAISHNG